jgi:ABC-type multidrug transport system fused ATPase/permease subunit
MSRSFAYFRDSSDAKRAAKRVFEIVDTKSPIDVFDSTPKNRLTDFSGEIEFDNVCFSYPQIPDAVVLNKFSLTFPSGKTVAIVGPRYKLFKLIN